MFSYNALSINVLIFSDWSWWLGEVLKDWRKANVTPIFKMGKKEDPENYRLVSLTLIPGKALDQLILDTISRQIKDKKITRSGQHGFTEGNHARPTW